MTTEFFILEIVQVSNFILKKSILSFWTKLAQNGFLQSKNEKVSIAIEFCMVEIV